jgi:hypothetical protein
MVSSLEGKKFSEKAQAKNPISYSVIASSILSVLTPPVGADVLPLKNDMIKG